MHCIGWVVVISLCSFCFGYPNLQFAICDLQFAIVLFYERTNYAEKGEN